MNRSLIISLAVIASFCGIHANAQSEVNTRDAAQITDSSNGADSTEKDPITKFNCVQLSYFGGLPGFSEGFYGIGYELFGKKWVTSLSFHGSWGITDPGFYGMRLGIGYALSPAPWFAFMLKAIPFWQTYVSDVRFNKGEIKYDTSIGGGILASPGIRLRISNITIGANFDIGYAYLGGSGLYKDIMLTLGVKI